MKWINKFKSKIENFNKEIENIKELIKTEEYNN